MDVLEHLRARQREGAEFIDGVLAAVEARANPDDPTSVGFTPEEDRDVSYIEAELAPIEERISLVERQASRRDVAGQASRSAARVIDEPLTYSRHSAYNGDNVSYFRDMTAKATGRGDVAGAEMRLARHGQEMDRLLPDRARRREETAEREMRGRGYENPFEKRVNPNRTDGTGGYLVPPLWLMDELIPILRAGRTTANLVRQMDLPEGTDSINIPKLSTGTTTAIQTADAGAVSSTDFTDTSVAASVKTIAGQQDVSIQLVEQSPLPVDEVVFRDLIADYNKKLDLQVLAGSNGSGQVQGMYSSAGASLWTGYSTVAYTDASPTAPELLSPLAASLSKIAQARFDISQVAFVMHPRRWFWIVGAVDGNSRPLAVPQSNGPFNAMTVPAGMSAEGYVGNLALGAPVYIDANVTTADTAGAGSGQDVIFALNTTDAYLFEGSLRQRTLPEILSGSLQIRFQVYNYLAFLLRYGEALAIISGTGMAAPSGF